MIKVIAFDLDDTLWAVRPVIINAEKTLDAWLKTNVPDLVYDVVAMRELRHELLQEQPQLAGKVTAFRHQLLTLAMTRSGISNSAARQTAGEAMEVFLEARNRIEFFDGALDAIRTLAKNYHLGALTNGNADIRRLGLAEYFSFAFSAEDVGAPKPAPNLFHRALAHTGTEPAQMVYVGDDPKLDVDTANTLGLHTVWVKNPDKPEPGDTEADEKIDHVRHLPEAIDRLMQKLQ